jgi:hypothetical protein
LTGIPDDIGNPPPDSANSEIGIRVEDGSEGVAVVCSVKAQTGGFFVVKATVASSDPDVAFSINGSVDTLGVGTAVIGLSTRALPADVLSPTNIPCTLQVVSNNGLAFKPGALWARFQCTSLVSPPTYNCAVSGETVLENCAN